MLEKGLIVKLRAVGKPTRTQAARQEADQCGTGVGYGSGFSGATVGSRRGSEWEDGAADGSPTN